jgi:hypothetical protein
MNSPIEKLRKDMEELTLEAKTGILSPKKRKVLDMQVRQLMSSLSNLLDDLDPIKQPISVFDPSNPKVVGRFVALALVAQPRQPLASVGSSYGSGVYAIYYSGNFDAYKPISGIETPIYVGQAAPLVSNARSAFEQGDKLTKRMREHAKNISKATSTLDIADFECRVLVVQSGWETAAEDFLIHLFKPIWNSETKILYGLGKHGDDAGTRGNKRSPWDTFHPGREWAVATLADAKSISEISTDLMHHFEKTKIYSTIDDVLHEFIDELRQI